MRNRIPVNFTLNLTDNERDELEKDVSYFLREDNLQRKLKELEYTRKQLTRAAHHLAWLTAVEQAMAENIYNLTKSQWGHADNLAKCQKCGAPTAHRFEYQPQCFPECQHVIARERRETREKTESAGKDILAQYLSEQEL